MKLIKPIKKTTMPFEDKALVQLRQIEKLLLQETPVVRGKYAKEIFKKISRKPSQQVIVRNKKARKLLEKLWGKNRWDERG